MNPLEEFGLGGELCRSELLGHLGHVDSESVKLLRAVLRRYVCSWVYVHARSCRKKEECPEVSDGEAHGRYMEVGVHH